MLLNCDDLTVFHKLWFITSLFQHLDGLLKQRSPTTVLESYYFDAFKLMLYVNLALALKIKALLVLLDYFFLRNTKLDAI